MEQIQRLKDTMKENTKTENVEKKAGKWEVRTKEK